MIQGEQVHLPANKQHNWMQLPSQEAPEIARLGSWKEQSSLLLMDFAQASPKVPEVPVLGRRDLPLQSCSPAQGAGNHCSHVASRQLRKLHEHHTKQGIHVALLRPAKRNTTTLSHQMQLLSQGDSLPHTCWPDTGSRGLQGTVAFCRLTWYHGWSRNIAGQWTSNTSSSLVIQLEPVMIKGPAPIAARPAHCLNTPRTKAEQAPICMRCIRKHVL